MNSSIALRLLWKEYRVQRGLWLSMAAGSIMLQVLITFLIRSDQESFQGIVPIAFMLTSFYAIGSGAITFAIEREEGTQLRPVMLGCPPGLTLIAKTLFGIVTTTLLLAVTMCSGMLLSLGSLTLPEGMFQPDVQRMIVPLALLFVVLPYLGCLLWSTFFSLLTRKVIVALGLAAVAMIGSFVVVGMTYSEMILSQRQNQSHPTTGLQLFLAALVPCFMAMVLLAMNYLLTHRWLTRAFFDQTSAKSPSFFKRWRFRRSGLDGGMVVEIGVEDRTAFEVVSPDVAVHQPPPRFGLSLLYGTWGPNLWRHLRFLRWREAIETRKIFVGFLLATMVFVTWNVMDNANHHGWHGFAAFFVHAACLACGAMAFRTEQDERKVQRLADMGLRPATVWLSKHVVWFTRAIMSVAAILFCVLFVSWLYSSYSSRMGVGRFFDAVWLNAQLPNSMPNYDSGVRMVGRAMILTLTMYGIGQVCSQLIRSTIVSMFVSFILGLTAFGWAGVCFWFDVPFILSVLPLAIGCLLVTWCRTNSWMKDDNRLRTWTWPVVSLTVATSVVYFGTGLFRVYEIPWTEPFFGETAASAGNNGLTEEQQASVLDPVSKEARETFQLYQRAAELLGRRWLETPPLKTDLQRFDLLSNDDKRTAEQALLLTLEATESKSCAEFSPGVTDIVASSTSRAETQFRYLSQLLLIDARRKLRDGSIGVALDRCRATFTLSRHNAGSGHEEGSWSSHAITRSTLAAIQEIGRHPEADEQTVEEASRIIDEHRKFMMPIEVTNYATAVMIRNTLQADAFALAELVSDSDELAVLFAAKFPGELTRSLRVLNAMESLDVETMAAYRGLQAAFETGNSPGMANWYHSRHSVNPELAAAIRSAARPTPLLDLIMSSSAIQLCVQDTDTECRIRATKIMLRLFENLRKGEELPPTLAEFGPSLNDPWSGKPFVWYPDGLPAGLKERNNVRVEANTPFLISFRISKATISRVEHFDDAHARPIDDEAFEGLGSPTIQAGDAALQGGEEAAPKPTPGQDETAEKANVRIEFLLGGPHEFGNPNVFIWELPKRDETKNGVERAADGAE